MNPLLIILAGVATWWVVGVILTTFFVKSFVSSDAPLGVRLSVMLKAGFLTPWALVTSGMLPIIIVTPSHMTPEQTKEFEKWREDNAASCNCPNCRRERGE